MLVRCLGDRAWGESPAARGSVRDACILMLTIRSRRMRNTNNESNDGSPLQRTRIDFAEAARVWGRGPTFARPSLNRRGRFIGSRGGSGRTGFAHCDMKPANIHQSTYQPQGQPARAGPTGQPPKPLFARCYPPGVPTLRAPTP
jgi:hypothetical protein